MCFYLEDPPAEEARPAAAALGDGDELETLEAELEAGEWCLLLPLAGQWAACPRQGELAPEQLLHNDRELVSFFRLECYRISCFKTRLIRAV